MKDYIGLNRQLRAIKERISDVHGADDYAESVIRDYVRRDVTELRLHWPEGLDSGVVDRVESIVSEEKVDWWTLKESVTDAENQLDAYFIKQPSPDIRVALRELLEPPIEQAAFRQYEAGHFREAVLNSVMAVFDLLRERTDLDLDGAALVNQALSVDRPILRLANLERQAGRNIQVGFMDMLKGAYTGVRNPKAHRLETDLNAITAAQYLVFASLLARKLATAAAPNEA